ncbi:CoA ester lyase [Pseudomonas sp. 65/3-MNA-CIBAN-0223]|uniref:HpcH/HpaI aldolase/citrate lyase family protein n=1 Tax=Pseudomonas sp. 65/3-MNA-CIBAN-0223 TaxID=3140476 RepID=UPI0033298293
MNDHLMRSALFVPGNRPERFAKALTSGADVVIVDFEDAVQASDKALARDNLGAFLQATPTGRVWVRINMASHAQHEADLAFCASQSGVCGVMLPKAESAEQVARAATTGQPVLPIIESALGLQALAAISQVSGVDRLTYGGLDMSLDLGLIAGTAGAECMLDQVRFALLLHSRLAGLAPPLETVYARIDDPVGLEHFVLSSNNKGFAGMLCIHPRQVEVVHRALAPTLTQEDWARRVLASADQPGAFQLDGQMVDAPVIQRARNILKAANNA